MFFYFGPHCLPNYMPEPVGIYFSKRRSRLIDFDRVAALGQHFAGAGYNRSPAAGRTDVNHQKFHGLWFKMARIEIMNL
jgi:hypothetical protein